MRSQQPRPDSAVLLGSQLVSGSGHYEHSRCSTKLDAGSWKKTKSEGRYSTNSYFGTVKSASMRILIVDSETSFKNILQRSLKAEGYIVDGVKTAVDGFEYIKTYHYDMVLIEWHLSDGSGASLLKRLRLVGFTMPILILSAHSDLACKVESFQAGADDYVVKPVTTTELSIRIQALLRRGSALQESILQVDGLEINRLTRQVKRDGNRIELSAKEYSLLEYLFLNSGRVQSRSMIMEQIWDQPFEGVTNIVDVYIGHLRRKIDKGHEPKLIRTVRGFGYTFDIDHLK